MSSQPEGREIEEHFVLRVKDTELAKQIRDVLQGHSILDENESMKFHFEGEFSLCKAVCQPAKRVLLLSVAYPLQPVQTTSKRAEAAIFIR